MTDQEKTCPDCAELVKAAARVCKHCGYRFSEEASPIAPDSIAEATPADEICPLPSSNDWWSRTFDDPRGAKYGCLGMPLIAALGVLAFCTYQPANPSTDKQSPIVPVEKTIASAASKSIDTAAAGKLNVRRKLKDGDSAKFRDLVVSNSGDPLWALCGSVNSKNGFGAYTGYKRFVAFADGDAPTIIEDESTGLGPDMDRQLYIAANHRYCANVVDRF